MGRRFFSGDRALIVVAVDVPGQGQAGGTPTYDRALRSIFGRRKELGIGLVKTSPLLCWTMVSAGQFGLALAAVEMNLILPVTNCERSLAGSG